MPFAAPVVQEQPLAAAGPSARAGRVAGLRLAVEAGVDAALLASGLALAVALRLALAGWVGRFYWSAGAVEQYAICAGIGLALLAYEGVYAGGLASLDQTDRLVKALTGGLAATILYSFATQRSEDVSRFVLILGYLICLILFTLLRPLLRRRFSFGAGLRVVADPDLLPLLGGLARGGARVTASSRAGAGGDLLVACMRPAEMGEGIADWEIRYSGVGLIPVGMDITAMGAEPVNLHGVQVFSISHPMAQPFNRGVKRAMDVAGAGALLLLTSPLWALAAAAVRLETAGPCIYGQERLGQGGRRFRALKFRSMHQDAAERLQTILAGDPDRAEEFRRTFKLRDDPRVTRVGKFLRRTSLDELPQLWNVLRGDMSLVGPRPIVAAERELYGAAYPVVATVRPGLTGVWQTSGRNGVAYESRKHFDVFYVRRWSVWLDVAILVRTLQAMVLPADY
jgi:lipopolysaccharide/colanic/teichoic acid biosynthesis glycosyltransferase